MTLHRFFLDPDCFQSDRVEFPPDRSHQIANVLRLKEGDRVIAFDGSGLDAIVRLEQLRPRVQGTVEERRQNLTEPRVSVVLYQAVLKSTKFELVLQKCTELGVGLFVPVITARSVAANPSASKQARFRAIVTEAAEQSRRGHVPGVFPAMEYPEAIAKASHESQVMLPYEGEGGIPLNQVHVSEEAPISLFIGPEGGFTDSELALATKAGAGIATLGPRTLRAETAAIAATALLLARLDQLG